MRGKVEVRRFKEDDTSSLVPFLRSTFDALGHDFLPASKDSDIGEIATTYGGNDGAFFVAGTDAGICGCVGLRRFSEGIAEMKRLYVSDGFRGGGLGRALCSKAIGEARRLGFQTLRLDTTRRSVSALALFRDLGFYEIARYNDDPFAEVFMEYRGISKQVEGSQD
nr:GNAT family N-acetyltransferase [Luteolibacter marinus]